MSHDPIPSKTADTRHPLDIANSIAAFSEEQVERLTKLSKRRLRYWDESGFFNPSYREENSRLPYSRFYSFKDVVALRTLETLRVQNGVPLQHLRKVADRLAHLREALWTETRLFVADRKVVLVNPETGQPQEVVSGQYILIIPLGQIIADTRKDAEKLRRRTKAEIGTISRSRAILHNAPVIAGTRIPVAAIRRMSEDGYTTGQIIGEYPDLTPRDVRAALIDGTSKVA